MASISSQLQLIDVVSTPLLNISGALSNAISSFEQMQSACDNSVDADNFNDAKNKIIAASVEVGKLEDKLQSLTPPNIDIPIRWDIQSSTDIFSGMGAERFKNETQALNDILNNVLKSQQSIGEQALQIDVLPPEASWDINFVNQKIEELGNKMSELKGIDINNLSDDDVLQLSNSYENLRSGMSQITNVQESINQALSEGDISSLNSGYNELSRITERVERQVRNNINAVQELNNIDWKSASNVQVFDGAGIERMNSEMDSLNTIILDVLTNQQNITTQAQQIDILPDNAVEDIDNANQRLQGLANKLAELQSQDISKLDSQEIERLNSEYESLRTSMNGIINLQSRMNQSLSEGDISQLNNGYNQLSSIAEHVERQVRNNINAIQELNNIEWQSSSNVEVFTTSGLERYKQEIHSANGMLSNLITTQQQIHNQASKTNILPDSMVTDINRVNDRISKLKTELVSIMSRPMDDLGADRASKQIEMLRNQLYQAVETQNDLNSAVERMDISSANQAYLKLNSTIDATERNIRDNFSEQNNFNTSIDKGTVSASKLEKRIGGFIAAYASIRTIGEVISLSDKISQTDARLNMIVDDGGTIRDLENKIFASAQRSRATYLQTTDTIAKLGMQAGDAFSNNDELVAFAEQLNKSFVLAGTDDQGVASTMYNLTQALASGVLRGQDLNAVMSNSMPIIQNIADYLDIPVGQIRDMAAEGQLSADVVKNAMLAAADETNARFEQMPMTFGQVFIKFKNDALMAFQPILNRLNEFANSDSFDDFVSNATNAIVNLSAVVLEVFDIMTQMGSFIYDNWSIIEPIVLGAVVAMGLYRGALIVTNAVQIISNTLKSVAAARSAMNAGKTLLEAAAMQTATGAQIGLNAALLACPLTWIIIAIVAVIAIIYAVVAAINKAEGTTISATGVIMGALLAAGAFLANLVYGIVDIFIGVFAAIWNIVAAFVNFFANVWSDPIGATVRLFVDLGDAILSIVEGIAKAIDKITGTDLAGSVQGWRNDMQAWADEKFGPAEIIVPKFEDTDAYAAIQMDRISYADAYDAGYTIGESIEDKFDLSNIFKTDAPKASDYTNDYTYTPTNGLLGDIADDTSAIKDAVDISQEDLKYLRDIAERDVINRFTTAEIHVDMGGCHKYCKQGY